jgi:hypothetical protein
MSCSVFILKSKNGKTFIEVSQNYNDPDNIKFLVDEIEKRIK